MDFYHFVEEIVSRVSAGCLVESNESKSSISRSAQKSFSNLIVKVKESYGDLQIFSISLAHCLQLNPQFCLVLELPLILLMKLKILVFVWINSSDLVLNSRDLILN